MSAHTVTHLIHVYGCAIVFAAAALQALGAPLPGTTVLVAAAVYASTRHGLPIAGVIAAGASGALLGTTVAYGIGRGASAWVLARIGSNHRAAQLRAELATRGAPWVFVARFVTGLRNIIGLAAGASRMPPRRFVAVSAAAAVTWALVSGLEYYWFGRALAGADTWVQVVLVVLGIAWLVLSLRFLRRRALTRLRAAEG